MPAERYSSGLYSNSCYYRSLYDTIRHAILTCDQKPTWVSASILLSRSFDLTWWLRPPGRSRNKWLDPPRDDSIRPIGELWRRAVDRGHGGATTRRPSPATRPWCDNMSDLRGNYLSASSAQQVFKAINFFGRSLWVFGNCWPFLSFQRKLGSTLFCNKCRPGSQRTHNDNGTQPCDDINFFRYANNSV